jgi:predicted nucleic acid-binding Zn ribbon protein
VRDPDGLVALRDVLAQAAGKLGVSDALATGALWRGWSDIVGDDVATHAEPTSLKEGVLRVRADSPVWATELGYLAEDIRARINRNAGSELVSKVIVWTGPGKGSAAPKTAGKKARARGSDDVVVDDPMEALERAESAWRKARSKGTSEASTGGVENLEKPC